MNNLKAFFLVTSSIILVIFALILANSVTAKAAGGTMDSREIVLATPQEKLDFLFDFLNTAQDVLDNGNPESENMAKAAITVMYNYVTINLPDRAMDLFYTQRIIERRQDDETRDTG